MSFREPSWTLGIEEEYLLVDRASRELAVEPPEDMLRECGERLADSVRPEFLKSQIEVGTGVCADLSEARRQLAELRRTVAEVAGKYGLAPIAASTHPFANWAAQKHTDKERYHLLARDMQAAARRLVICGMHVHVAVEDEDMRIDLMNQATYFLPHLLALSASSPFWEGEQTGLKSFRQSVFKELPRTGLPGQFSSFNEYQRHVDVLVKAGVIVDASMLWWDVRPNVRFPTLEMRITDICTTLDDALSLAAIYRCVLHMLVRLRRANQRWRQYAPMLIDENRWRAQRYGYDEGLLDFGRGEVVDCAELLEELIVMLREDAAFFGCQAEIEHARAIHARGTSAHRQIAAYEQARAEGADHREALMAVVDFLIAETVRGL